MKKVLLMFALVAISASSFAAANAYRIDDVAVEATFDQSLKQVAAEQDVVSFMETNVFEADIAKVENPDGATAGILALFLGYIGVHRLYLDSPFKVALIYWITCGGVFGIFPIIDAIKLFTADDISEYIGNEKFKMW